MSFTKMSVWLMTLLVLCTVVYSTADEDYENKLTKLWSLTGSSNSDGSAVLNVTSASIVIQPSSYGSEDATRNSRQVYKQYAFKPRAIPLRRAEQQSQVERNVYYAPDEKYKSDILFPGNYMPIAKEKSNENLTKDSVYSPRGGRTFHPKAIPLLRSEEFQKRSLDEDMEPIIKKPEGFSEQSASRRSIPYFFGDDDEAEDAEDDGEDDVDTEDGTGKHRKKPKIKPGKLKKYVMPLLLAYKMKYFTLVPVMIGGLILLVGATGLAGFFFALFAAVMGLQKGGY